MAIKQNNANTDKKIQIAILGGGPAGMFMFKRLMESGKANLEIHIFERKNKLGQGMPYSSEGAGKEHVTNVSDNEVPEINTSIEEWLETAPKQVLRPYNITPENFNEFKVVPRLLFGRYLSDQFKQLISEAKKKGIVTHLHLKCNVTDVIPSSTDHSVSVTFNKGKQLNFQRVIVCTGHFWPKTFEDKIDGFYDSPYPPSKLKLRLNHPIAIKGSSLTAIDALRTLARSNGKFKKQKNGKLTYQTDQKDFRIIMHSINGLLPAVRFHLEDSRLHNDSLLTESEITRHIHDNNGFLSLDYIFEQDFKQILKEKKDPIYPAIKHMSMEDFVNFIMTKREQKDAFELLEAEYIEAENSIKNEESVYWKEMLAVLSFAMNYPAKYFSAEDMIRLKKVLSPLISIVIAFIPQSSCREMLALHQAGVLNLVSVDQDSSVKPEKKGGVTYHFSNDNGEPQSVYYKTFINCIGQTPLEPEDFPFPGLYKTRTITQATLAFNSNSRALEEKANGNKNIRKKGSHYYLKVPGIKITDHFQVINARDQVDPRVFVMAVPYIGGYNPDYSGLDFCEEASARIMNKIFDED